ncbi:MAG: hypothetical protein ACRDWH_03560 [Acidimicrobiia bacterium]
MAARLEEWDRRGRLAVASSAPGPEVAPSARVAALTVVVALRGRVREVAGRSRAGW